MSHNAKPKTIVVLGGTGFLGPHLVNILTSAGHRLVLYNRGTHSVNLPTGTECVHGTFDQIGDFRDRFRQYQPDAVIYMRPMSEGDTQVIVRAFRGICPRLVLISSQDVYRAYGILNGFEEGEPDLQPITEDSALRKRFYLYHDADIPALQTYEKILAERTALADKEIQATILRLPIVYGPGDNQMRLHHPLRRMEAGRPYIILHEEVAEARFSRGYVENVCSAIARATLDDRAIGRTYNVTEHNLSLIEWLHEIAAIMNWTGTIHRVPSSFEPHEKTLKPQQLVVDSSRIRTELDFHDIVPFGEGLRRTIAWERAQNPASPPHSELMDERDEDALAEEYGLND